MIIPLLLYTLPTKVGSWLLRVDVPDNTIVLDLIVKRIANIYYINEEIDLQGKSIIIYPDCTLFFEGDGKFLNGSLIGDNTKIMHLGCIFDNVSIEGSWIVPVISTGMFSDLRSDNSLCNVIALSNPLIHNKIIIEEGDYWLTTTSDRISGLSLHSNTDLVIDGNIRLRPNKEKRSYVISIVDSDNVCITGNGAIIGDKDSHLGLEGEWGMGIAILGSSFVRVKDVSISNCWGDCIYIAKQSSNITIEDVDISNSRRQGISVVGCDGCLIQSNKISFVKGTLPEYGIDLEPNSNQSVRNVVIENNYISNCQGGILTYGAAENSVLENIKILNNKVFLSDSATHYSFAAFECHNIILGGNSLISKTRNCLKVIESSDISFDNNEIESLSGNIIRNSQSIFFVLNTIHSYTYAFNDISGLNLINNTLNCNTLAQSRDAVDGLLMDFNIITGTIPKKYINSIITNNVFMKNSEVSLRTINNNRRKNNNIVSNNSANDANNKRL